VLQRRERAGRYRQTAKKEGWQMSRIETAALALVQKAPGGGNKTFAKLVIGIVVLVMGILAVALVLTQKSAAFNSKPSAFVE
jgi:hypothetical protein